MGNFWHTLKRNKTGEFPRNWIFTDTETSETTVKPGLKRLVLRLGVAEYEREAHGDHKAKHSVLTFTKPGQFWTWVLASVEPGKTAVVMGYNVGFDFRILDGFRELFKRGFTMRKIYTGQSVFILEMRSHTHRVLILDACNYFDGTLEEWGKMLGVRKVKVNFNTVSHDKLLERCRVDVEILRKLWWTWRKFITLNNLGHFSLTKSGQALTAYVHRFMSVPVFIHADREAIALERQAYYGGRVECFKLGVFPRGRYYKLDVNSMYPAAMRREALPCRFVKVFTGYEPEELPELCRSFFCIAEVWLKTEVPAFPHYAEARLTFPVGTFRAVLCGAELAFAVAAGAVVKVDRLAVYRKAVLFREYVDGLYSLRNRYKAENNSIMATLCKKLLNTLYGKWGQQSRNWNYLGFDSRSKDGLYKVADKDTGFMRTVHVICGHSWEEAKPMESYNSFPAISAGITAAARVRLWKLITTAGRSNVLYVDTDSLIVNECGYRRLRKEIHPSKLGALKLEYMTRSLTLNAPKDYKTDTECKVKGITSKARKLSANVFEYWQWEGIQGALSAGHHAAVFLTKTRKTLARQYSKGQVSASGEVSPLRLSDG